MRYYPLFLDLKGRDVVFSGAGEHAAAKIALLLKTRARLRVFGPEPCGRVRDWAQLGRIELVERPLREGDADGAALLYGANDEPDEDARAAAIGRAAGALVNVVDDPGHSQFITPALVDRDPVVIAIGTERTAPVLARSIKARVEAMLPPATGRLARIANAYRRRVAKLAGTKRRALWARYFGGEGEAALQAGGNHAVARRLEALIEDVVHDAPREGSVALVGAGPGDPELLTRKAQRLLNEADVVVHDRLVGPGVLELARREARLIEVGKTGFGVSWKQADIDALIVAEARKGARVVRLKGGDPAVFGRLDEEVAALREAAIAHEIVPGITAASAAAAAIGTGLTKRGRNGALTVLTGHDVEGFAEHDWSRLARPGSVAAIYMGLRAATFLRGRLLMHGADASTPVTAVFNASREDQRIVETTLIDLPDAVRGVEGAAVLLYGIAPAGAGAALATLPAEALPASHVAGAALADRRDPTNPTTATGG